MHAFQRSGPPARFRGSGSSRPTAPSALSPRLRERGGNDPGGGRLARPRRKCVLPVPMSRRRVRQCRFQDSPGEPQPGRLPLPRPRGGAGLGPAAPSPALRRSPPLPPLHCPGAMAPEVCAAHSRVRARPGGRAELGPPSREPAPAAETRPGASSDPGGPSFPRFPSSRRAGEETREVRPGRDFPKPQTGSWNRLQPLRATESPVPAVGLGREESLLLSGETGPLCAVPRAIFVAVPRRGGMSCTSPA